VAWTPSQLPPLAGRTAVVTGANSGIGLVTALELARHGAAVTMACRNLDLAERGADRIRRRVPGARIAVARLDLASLEAVRAFAAGWSGPLDVLVNNAGVMMPRTWQPTQDGFELQFGGNHLGHFALTGLLLPALLSAREPRVATVSSLAHFQGAADVVDGNPVERYRAQSAYGNSKLANLLFARELQRLADQHGAPVVSTAAHPGVSATNLFTSRSGVGASRVVRTLAPLPMKVLLQSAAAGANASLYAATRAAAGSYTGPTWLGGSRGPIGAAPMSALARDDALARLLWERSEELTGIDYAWAG